MSPKQANKNSIRKNSPLWQKKLLLGLLFVSAIAGYAGNVYLALHAHSNIQPNATGKLERLTNQSSENFGPALFETILPRKLTQPDSETFNEVRDLFRTAMANQQNFVSLHFQGTLASRQGDSAIAIINDDLFAVGTGIEGVNIVSISNRVLTLEYNGETKTLGVGETISVLLD